MSTPVEELAEDVLGEYIALWLGAYDWITILLCNSE